MRLHSTSTKNALHDIPFERLKVATHLATAQRQELPESDKDVKPNYHNTCSNNSSHSLPYQRPLLAETSVHPQYTTRQKSSRKRFDVPFVQFLNIKAVICVLCRIAYLCPILSSWCISYRSLFWPYMVYSRIEDVHLLASRPLEVSSRRPVQPPINQPLIKKIRARDPRFSELSGELHSSATLCVRHVRMN